MKTTAILLLGILLACTACEKETIETPPDYINLLGSWDLHHKVDGEITKDYIINGETYNYNIIIFNECMGRFKIYRNGSRHWSAPFYLDIQKDSLHINYFPDIQPSVMLPKQGWTMYRQYDNVLLIGSQQWLK